MDKQKPLKEVMDEGGGYLCNICVCPNCFHEISRINGEECPFCGALIEWDDE